MSFDEEDAYADYAYEQYMSHLYEEIGPEWARDHADELFEQSYDEATQRFTEERLKSYYLQKPDVAVPAVTTVEYAKKLLPAYPAAATVFAATSVELTWKGAILKPLVFGLVHVDALASAIVDRTIPRTGGLTQLNSFLSAVLKETAGIDFANYTRKGSSGLLREEINSVTQARNNVLHLGAPSNLKTAEFAIEVAESVLVELYPKLLNSLGLRLDGLHIVHENRISSK